MPRPACPSRPALALDWKSGTDRLSGSARTHFAADGAPLSTGERFQAPGQAEVLRRIAKDGRKGFL